MGQNFRDTRRANFTNKQMNDLTELTGIEELNSPIENNEQSTVR